ncbi:MAG: GntR family transcriptional regulator [Acidobacteriota bacterium]
MLPHSPATFADAYQRIKKGILDLRYQPGQKLSEAKLAAELKLGRSPIRSALARLERDGWVRVLPQNGTFVRRFTPEEVAAMSELRLLLEAHAASVAATRVAPQELAELRLKFEALKAKGASKNFDEFLALDDLFHGMVYRLAGNAFIAQILNNLRDQIHWIRVTTATLPGRVEESLLEMDRVLHAMEHRDALAAAEAMRQHIGNIAVSYEALPGAREEGADAA